jgi:hypothetical protein
VAWDGLCGGRFLILHVDDGAIYAVEGLVNGVVTVLVSVRGGCLRFCFF